MLSVIRLKLHCITALLLTFFTLTNGPCSGPSCEQGLDQPKALPFGIHKCPSIPNFDHSTHDEGTDGTNPKSIVTYTCEKGYNNLGGSELECDYYNTGSWKPMGDEPSCQGVEQPKASFLGIHKCPSIPNFDHSTHDKGTDGTNPKSIVSYTCENGYNNLGGSKLECDYHNTGSWKPIGDEPSCKEMCPALSIPHGAVKPDVPVAFGKSVTVNCKAGYTLQGKGTVTCGSDGQWTKHDPMCRVDCKPFSLPNGYLEPDGNIPFNGTVQISCKSGYRLVGPKSRRCDVNGTWKGYFPQCIEVKCDFPRDPDNGYILNKNDTINTTVTYRCNKGHRLLGDAERRCKQNGSWTGVERLCQPIDCEIPVVPLGQCELKGKPTTYKNRVKCWCSDASGQPFDIICNYKGQWQPDPQDRCHMDCAIQTPGSKLTKIKHLSHQQCLCDEKKKAQCKNGTLDRTKGCFAECFPPRLLHGAVRENTQGNASLIQSVITISFSCDEGYSLNGSGKSVCMCSGKWKPEPPVCVENTNNRMLPVEPSHSDLNQETAGKSEYEKRTATERRTIYWFGRAGGIALGIATLLGLALYFLLEVVKPLRLLFLIR